MPLSSESYPVTITQGIRNLLQGRVLLKEDASAGDSILKVGMEFNSPWEKMNTPGTAFFYGETNNITVVQPGSSNDPDDIEYSENVTIDGLEINAYHLPIAETLGNDYTTARGAYVRWRTLPDYVNSLKIVQEDFLQLGAPAPEERLFPCVFVEEVSSRLNTRFSNLSWIETTRVIVRYFDIMDDDYDRQDFKETAVAILNVIRKDHTLGGTCYDSLAEAFIPGGQGVANQRRITTKNDILVDWADILVVANRIIPYDKVSPA